RPISPVEPMYIAGRLRTASIPPKTLMEEAEYSASSGSSGGAILVLTGIEPEYHFRSRSASPRPQLNSRFQRVSGLDPHRHDDVAVLRAVAGAGAELAGRDLVLDLQQHLVLGHRLEEILQVLGVEADHQRRAAELGLELFLRLAQVAGGGRQRQLVGLDLDPDGVAALVGELIHALDGGGELLAVERQRLQLRLG